MAKYPREEISYKKIYKKLDLDRELGIDFPELDLPTQIEVVDERKISKVHESYAMDEDDHEFCAKNEILGKDFMKIFTVLDKAFLAYIFKRLDKLRIVQNKSPCDICGKNKNNSDAEKFTCQGCNLVVHKSCYGVVDESKKRWLCRACIFHFEKKSCKFCLRSDGAMKKVNNGEWGHLVCVMLNKSLGFCNDSYREPIEIVDKLIYEGVCSICHQKSDYLIKCSFDNCKVSYHASCCSENYYSDLGNAITYCDDHNPLKNYKKIMSKRSMLNLDHGYPDLENKVNLRLTNQFHIPKTGQFLKIVNTEVKIFSSKIRKFKGDSNVNKIANYWKDKRDTYGYYYDDVFMFSNRFLRK